MNKNTQIEVYKMDGKWVVLANKKVLDIFPTKKKAMEYMWMLGATNLSKILSPINFIRKAGKK